MDQTVYNGQKLPRGVEVRRGETGDRIRVFFSINRKRCRETLGVPATQENIEYAGSLVREIKNLVERGLFEYREYFPNSKMVKKHYSTNAFSPAKYRDKIIEPGSLKISMPKDADFDAAKLAASGSEKEILNLPRFDSRSKISGIYFLIKDGRIVYVGQSENVHYRAFVHAKQKDFDSYTYIPCELSQLGILEAAYINALKPELNIVHPFASSLA